MAKKPRGKAKQSSSSLSSVSSAYSSTETSSSSSSSSSGSCSCCSCETEESQCSCPRICDIPSGCAPKTNCSRLGECRSSPAKCGDAKGSCRRAKSCVQSAVSCAVCEVKRSCSAAKARCLSKTNEASTSSAFICASCLAQSKSCQNVRSCASGGKSCSKNDGNNVQGQTDGNGNRKCCRKKTNPNHQCKSKSGNNATIPSSTVEVDNAKRNSNLSRLLDQDDVRGQLTAVEQMLQDVKKNVIDKRKKQQQLSMSTSMPEKIIRFEDETNMTTNNMKRFGIRGGGGGGSVSPTRSSLKSFRSKNNNNDLHKRHHSRNLNKHDDADRQSEKLKKPVEDELRHLEKIRDGVTELKRRHIGQNLTLKQTQDRLRRALEQLESR